MNTTTTENTPPIDRFVRVYMRMRDQRELITRELEGKIKVLDEKMLMIKAALLDHCKSSGVDSITTANGVAYRTVRTFYSTADWENFHRFVVEHNAPHWLEKRLHQGNMKEFLTDNPEMVPPGLNSSSEYTITIRRK